MFDYKIFAFEMGAGAGLALFSNTNLASNDIKILID
jgi:hypothetical protein